MTRVTANCHRKRRGTRFLLLCVAFLSLAFVASADAPKKAKPYPMRVEWDAAKKNVFASLNFRSVVDPKIRAKLRRGLPTTIVFTAAVYRLGDKRPIATTAQSCRITWLVWEEVYQIVMTRPGGSSKVHTPSVEGILRRCAQANRLIVGTRAQIPEDTAIRLDGRVQVNPVSKQMLTKIRRWVSRPSATGTAAPGDTLFSTFSGLFLQRIGAAERELRFKTIAMVPLAPKPTTSTATSGTNAGTN
jgi:hypothetical protein